MTEPDVGFSSVEFKSNTYEPTEADFLASSSLPDQSEVKWMDICDGDTSNGAESCDADWIDGDPINCNCEDNPWSPGIASQSH